MKNLLIYLMIACLWFAIFFLMCFPWFLGQPSVVNIWVIGIGFALCMTGIDYYFNEILL